jgi:hypothetical protein
VPSVEHAHDVVVDVEAVLLLLVVGQIVGAVAEGVVAAAVLVAIGVDRGGEGGGGVFSARRGVSKSGSRDWLSVLG